MAKPSPIQLGARERQIMDAVHQLGEGSVADVRRKLADPPTYSTVRTMLRLLEKKGHLKHRRDGIKYVYRPAQAPEEARRSALQHLLKTFFAGSAGDAIATILDLPTEKMSSEEYDRLARRIEQA
ncbi:MAG TPA: BlaI/MecI/CopY family transcriptional regulator, partial [Planctomycetaceae bacterium]|nr:BlaI/MecI/CopY family transcriptional regulator [Planctomycetaceae bacterium]